MRVNEIIHRIDCTELVRIYYKGRNIGLEGTQEDIIQSEAFRELKVGNWLVTRVFTMMKYDKPISVPIICINAEKV